MMSKSTPSTPSADWRQEDDIDISVEKPILEVVPHLPPEGLDLRAFLIEQEISLIKQAIERASGVTSDAAKLLKINRTTLIEKQRKYGLSSPKKSRKKS